MTRSVLIVAAMAWSAGAAGRNGAPLHFLPNQGQAPSEVRFLVRGSGATAYFLANGALFQVGDSAVQVEFEGSEVSVRVEGTERLSGLANFLSGPEESWRLSVPMFGGIAYRGLYPGIDMTYSASGRNLKSEFVAAPGADPFRIRIRYEGAGALRLAPDGALIIPVGDRELREEAPRIYQQRGGRRARIEGHYSIAGDSVGFLIGEYDRSAPLVIDPLLYSTLLGGASSDAATAAAVDASGSAYVAGFTASYNFPTANPKQNFNAGGNEVFVAKLNPAGNGLVYCTYLGGSGDDRAYGIALGPDGSAYVAGYTTSRNFPTSNPVQSRLTGARNAFVLRLNPAGNGLVFSTYLGGTGSDSANAIAVDGSGNAYIAGDTTSTGFPVTGLQTSKGGSQDAFVAKLNGDGILLYSTYLGGNYDDHAAGIAVDGAGSAYITGSTYSPDFPLAQPWQNHIGGGQDAFIARLSAGGGSLQFSTYLGGSGGELGYPEAGQGIAVDAQGNAYVAGATPSADFPLLHAAQSARRGSLDAFAAKANASGVLQYSTYLGGTGQEIANAVAVSASGAAYVAGQTYSTDLPVVSPVQAASGGGYDAFIGKLAPSGDSVQMLSYLGGSGSDTATAIALDGSVNFYVAGWTLSTNFPVVNGYQSVNAGTYGAFVTKLGSMADAPPGSQGPSPVSVTPASGSGTSQTFAFLFNDSQGYSAISTVSMIIHTSTSGTASCYLYYVRATNAIYLANDAGTAWLSPLTLGQSGTLQNSQCAVNAAGSSFSASGNSLTVNLALTFLPAFNGSKNIYMLAYDGQSSGWQQKGTFTVEAVSNPFGPVAVTPSSGTGGNQTFAFAFTDPKGAASIYSASVIVGVSLSAASSCYLYYARASNSIYLANDAGTAWLSPLTLGQSGTLQNSQCAINAAASSSILDGNTLTLNLALTFLPAYDGARNIYMMLYDAQSSGWVQKGTWTVNATPVIGPVSVTPSSGSGSSQSFAFSFFDPNGASAISSASVIIGNSLSGSSSCYLYFARASNSLYLANDAGTAWLAPVALGQNGTLQNSQCAVNTAASAASLSGNNLTLSLALTFPSAFSGSKKVYMMLYDGQSSGWLQKGIWSVP